jgi:NAD(P)-dependent dehydrogenase (short-subunit alcohol dehydrogenase family)
MTDRAGAHEGRVVLVTGGATGIGAAYTRAFAGDGARVIVADLAAEEGRSLADEVGGSAVFVQADVTSEASLAELTRVIRAELGGLDAVVNNAALYQGIAGKRDYSAVPLEEWDRVMTVNVRGVWQCIKAVAPLLEEGGGGQIVNISSSAALSGIVGFPHYVASKAAVIGLTRALARELAPARITVNAVAPGLVENEASRGLNTDAQFERAVAVRSITRPMTADDLVGAVLFLASPAASFMTGQTVVVDGGTVFL